MIRSFKSITAAAMLLVTTLVFTSCEGALDDIFGEWDRPGTVTSISLTSTTLTLVVGEADVTLTYTIEPANATDKTVIWSSDNTAVATVDATGRVHAVAEGTATITVQVGKKTATCVVTVIAIPITYETYRAWDGTALTAQKVSTSEIQEVTEATTSLHEGFYIVKKDVTIPTGLVIDENTQLILCDGATLTINGYIEGPCTTATYSLTIYGQENQTGKLIVNAQDSHNGILVKDLEIHGGDIRITGGDGGTYAAIQVGNDMKVYGGTIKATGGDNGVCDAIKVTNKMEVKGGIINATGGTSGVGIQINGTGTPFVVSGGTITAKGANSSSSDGLAGIAVTGASHITGGTINTTGGDAASGDHFGGAGFYSSPGISVDGGSVVATGGKKSGSKDDGAGVQGKINFTVTTAQGSNDNWASTHNLTSGQSNSYRYIKIQ